MAPHPRTPAARLGALALIAASIAPALARAGDPWLTIPAGAGPGAGRSVVFLSGDEEYRSEEGLPQLAKILATRHGFGSTVLFSVGADGVIDPTASASLPGLDALKSADLVVMLLRFRNPPPAEMRKIADYVESGRPIVALRTSTHAFKGDAAVEFGRYSFDSKADGWDGGFGRRVLGETWISHHGSHGSQATRGVVAPGAESHPILRGIRSGDIFGPTDVYGVRLPLAGDSRALVLGEVVSGMAPADPPVVGGVNDPMMPVAWTRSYEGAGGRRARVFVTTMGASQDLLSEGLRRLVVNACYWAVGLESSIPARSNVDLVGDYTPTRFGFGAFAKGVRPADLAR